MASNATIDGGLVFGSQVVNIANTNYIAESISIDDPTRIIDRNDENGEPAAQALVPGKITGSMTLQLAAANTPIPAKGSQVVLDQAAGGGNITVLISQVGQAIDHMSETKISVNFVKKLAS